MRAAQRDVVDLKTGARLHGALLDEHLRRLDAQQAVGEQHTRELSLQAEKHESLLASHTDFETKAKNWMGALAQSNLQLKDEVKEHVSTLRKEREEQQVITDKRIAELDKGVAAGVVAVANAREQEQADVAMLSGRADALRQHLDALAATTRSELARLSEEADRVAADVLTRAVTTDVQLLQSHLANVDRTLTGLREDLRTKAQASELVTTIDRLGDVRRDVSANRAKADVDSNVLSERLHAAEGSLKAQTAMLGKEISLKANAEDLSSLVSRVDAAKAAIVQVERRVDADRDQSNQCVVALEKEINKKAFSTNTDDLSARLTTAEQHTELLWKQLTQKADKEVVRQLESRTEDVEKTTAIRISDDVTHFSKDFYPKAEIDAMISRVWWRVGDQRKGGTGGAVRS
eukprot:TRINITY_DN6494_c0_g1_i2.p1 TRINITY_DN6494_c0_g1~~TRINITY_DN6494_c0_g1_i2.p1  ORF type:complete len:475 (+),score=122.28 TRINITY_DN6494_c0_g1_i2:211-1425(+)